MQSRVITKRRLYPARVILSMADYSKQTLPKASVAALSVESFLLDSCYSANGPALNNI